MVKGLTHKEKARLEEIKQEIVDFIVEYFNTWHKPFPIRLVSGRFGRTIRYWGGSFQETMRELNNSGRIRIILTEAGSRYVTPPIGVWNQE